MPDARDLTPPPGQKLSDEQRARIRAQLAAAGQPQPARPGRWLMPGLAAAVVTAIVGAGAYVAQHESGGHDRGLQTPLQPAATSIRVTHAPQSRPATTRAVRSEPSSTQTPGTATPTSPPATTMPPQQPRQTFRPGHGPVPVKPGSSLVPTGPGLLRQGPGTTCAQELHRAAEPSLRRAAVTAKRDYGPGTTYLYETKTAWVVCDDLTFTDGGASTLLAFHDKSQPYQPDTSTLAVSENFITKPDWSPIYDQFVAGGRDFDGVQSISYSFPDGHTENAVVGQNGLWSMTYLAAHGVFVDPKTNETQLDPITVTVHYTSGDVRTFTLQWGLDTCAQLNHGC